MNTQQSTISQSAAQQSRARSVGQERAPALDAFSALIAAAMAPNDYLVVERGGELFIEPARGH